ncbi:MAG TPA: PAS domain S-box protein [Chthoniobacteraceae bacterium]|nr:PAS domain S-box protein [Chthoniobacteraceae bacterium]
MKSLMESEERLRIVTESARVGVVMVNRDRRYVYANRTYNEILGLRPVDIVGERIADMLPDIYETQISPRLDRAFAGERVTYELRMPVPGGDHFYTVTYEPILTGEPAQLVVVVITDITGHKVAGEELRASEQRFRTMADAIPHLAWIANADGWIYWYNLRWYQYTGATPAEMEGWGWQSVHDPEKLPTVLSRWKESIATGEPFDMVVPLRGADGLYRPFLTRVIPLKDATGRVLQWIGTNTDISEQKRSEEALRASEAKFSAAFGNNPAAIALTRLEDGIIQDVNETWVDLLGYQREEIIGKSASQHTLWVDPAGREKYVRQLITAGVARGFEETFRTKSGAIITTELSGQVLEVGGERLLLSTLVDISERKRAEAAVRSSEEKFSAAFAHNPSAIALIRLDDGKYLDVNDAWVKLNGYARDEVIGATLSEISGAPNPETRDEHLRQVRERGWAHWPETIFIKKSGQTYTADSSAHVLTIGGVNVILSTTVDITDRKAREQLEAENRRIQEATRMKSDFLANMSHELRTPLNGIIGFAELLLDEKPGPINAKQREYMTDICGSGQHLLDLINDILDLSKIEAGKMELYAAPFPLERAVTEVCCVVKATAQKQGVAVQCAVAPGLDSVNLDEQRIKQVLYNLLSNGVKFSHPGGCVKVIAAPVDEGAFSIRVIDQGIGIKPEHLPYLFEEFRQIDSGPSRRYQGTGLGLALTRRIAELHGGSVAVESEFGNGSTFIVTLPITLAPQAR